MLLLLLSVSFCQLEIGSIAPNFTLSDENGDIHTLSHYKGQFVILYFYPKDNTPGCTKEACSFRDNYKQLHELNAVILGVSWDSVEKHASFKNKHSLPFTLLSDSTGEITKIYKANGWFFPKRYTFIINPEGKIVQVYKKFDISTHVSEIIKFIKDSIIK